LSEFLFSSLSFSVDRAGADRRVPGRQQLFVIEFATVSTYIDKTSGGGGGADGGPLLC